MAGRRVNGEGNIKQLPSGQWCAQIMDGYQPNGSRNMVYFKAHKKSEVIGQIREYWKQRDAGDVPSSSISFGEWADYWYADHQSQVQPSTFCGYQYTLKILNDYFGKRELQKIKPMEITAFFDYMKRLSYSNSYIQKCKCMLIQIYDAAESNEVTNSNPARKAKIKRSVPTLYDVPEDNKKDAFTEEEIKELKAKLRDDLVGNSILTMIGTGLRAQELLALQPEDIAMDGSSITVNKAIKMVGGVPLLGLPKSDRSRRIIPVPEDYRKHTVYLRYYGGKKYIWTSRRESGLFDVGVFRKQYYKALQEAPRVRKLSPHCCRHTYVSTLERNGVPMEQIARLAGHTHIAMTDRYLHVDQETLANAVSVLNG